MFQKSPQDPISRYPQGHYGQGGLNSNPMESGPVNAASPSPPIPMFLSRIDDNLSELTKTVQTLRDKLDPILCPESPTVGSPEGHTVSRVKCALADRLSDAADRQSGIIQELNRILGRLEI